MDNWLDIKEGQISESSFLLSIIPLKNALVISDKSERTDGPEYLSVSVELN